MRATAAPGPDHPASRGSTSGTCTPPDGVSDAYLFDRMVGFALAGDPRPATEALGLTRAALRNLVARHAPHLSAAIGALPADAGPGEEALEEPDYRDFILEHRAARADDEERWLATILARRSLGPNHLWQDLGLGSRVELNILLQRHFPALVRRNAADMKWKKFIYRQLCERAGVPICKAPNCAVCSDFGDCFGSESGAPLVTLAQLRRVDD